MMCREIKMTKKEFKELTGEDNDCKEPCEVENLEEKIDEAISQIILFQHRSDMARAEADYLENRSK